MDHTNFQDQIDEKSSCADEAQEEKTSESVSLFDLYKYLEGSWYIFIVVGLISAFCWGVGQAFIVAVLIQVLSDVIDDRRHSTLARKSKS
jgi:hypothetical protein